ncbi:MAG: phosphate signaling complex protein PhoU [Gammaproteobacteria bacterium]|nr:phosphate signaling complex protein PhoU [Gammaproteobacteria bacterium]
MIQRNDHIVTSYDDDLNRLRKLVRKTSKLALKQLRRAIKAMKEEDVATARKVVRKDEKINALDIQADDEIVRLIARRQPLGLDLREVMTISKIVNDLERIGDQAERLALMVPRFFDGNVQPPNANMMVDIYRLAARVDQMLESSTAAFLERDLERTVEVMTMDSELDEEINSAVQRLSACIMEDARSVGHVIDVVMGLRSLERIGGHATNIARYCVFMERGKDVRHEDMEGVVAEVGFTE